MEKIKSVRIYGNNFVEHIFHKEKYNEKKIIDAIIFEKETNSIILGVEENTILNKYKQYVNMKYEIEYY